MAYSLTKTKYMSGLQCHKRLWYEENDAEKVAPPGRAQNYIFQQGTAVGRLAERYPDGVLIHGHGKSALQQTAAAIQGGAPCLFEAAFVHEGVLVRCDIMVRTGMDKWEIIEVKGATKLKSEHLHDLAVQAYVVAGAGYAVRSARLMHINSRTCRYPDLDNLFMLEDVTIPVRALTAKVPARLEEMRAALAGDEPDIPIGHQCDNPYPCPLKHHCWKDVPEPSVFTIPRMSSDQIEELVRKGIYGVADLPIDYPLSPPQRAYVERVRSGKPYIDRTGIRAWLDDLEYPIYFFDFETVNFAVPRFEGMAPYQQLPFQYSVDILHRNGKVDHKEFLHLTNSDPRAYLIAALCDHIGPSGSVVVYYANFERSVLQELARMLPIAAGRINAIIDRLADQRDVFRQYYLHPGFAGSTSIKKVLPVVVPGLSYKDLAIQKGDEAQAAWLEMVQCADANDQAERAAELRAYCGRDTQAMLEIHKMLVALAKKT